MPMKTPMLEIDAPYFGYIRLVWLFMDGLVALFGCADWTIDAYDALITWGSRRWLRWPVWNENGGKSDDDDDVTAIP